MNLDRKNLPLSNLKVVELEGLAPSIYCGMILADYGAEVIIVNRPQESSLPVSTQNTFMNRGKKSIMLNMKKTNHLAILKKIIEKSDVLIDPYRPGILEKLGIGPEDCFKINKRLIICRITGYGQNGPYSSLAGHDINYLSYSGMLSTFGEKKGLPGFPNNLLADFAGGGALSVVGILIALIERERTGKGQVIDSSMSESVTYLGSFILALKQLNYWNNERGHNLLDSGAPFYGVYKCKDQRFIAVGAIEPKFYNEFITRFNLDKEIEEKCLENHLNQEMWDELKNIFTHQFQTKTLDEWTKINTDACVSPIIKIEEIPNSNYHIERRNFFKRENSKAEKEFDFETVPAPKLSNHPNLVQNMSDPPQIGQNTLEILRKFDIPNQEINQIYNELKDFIKCKL